MKRSLSVILTILIIMSLCTSVYAASPEENLSIMRWVLDDAGEYTFIEMIQYPKIKMTGVQYGDSLPVYEPNLEEVILQMDLSLSEKYFRLFENGGSIPELVMIGANLYDKPVFKIYLENCSVSGFTIADLGINRLSTSVKAVIKLKAEKVTTTKLDAPEARLQIVSGKKLDMGKLYLNGYEFRKTADLTNIEGQSIKYGYGSAPQYSDAELVIEYDEIGTLPNWLAEFDGTTDSNINPLCRLRYELSSSTTADKFAFEADLTAIAQELTGTGDIIRMLNKYTFRVTNVDFTAPAVAAGTPPAPSDPAPEDPAPSDPAEADPVIEGPAATDSAAFEPISRTIIQPEFRRATEHTWTGKWATTFGEMTLKQDGEKVTGEYGNPVETLEGTVSGSKLTGTWNNGISSGGFEFTMADDGKSFRGIMSVQNLRVRGSVDWNGERAE